MTENTGNDIRSDRKLEISPDILKDTVLCRSNFSCLDGDDACLCRAEDHIGTKILFVEQSVYSCAYKMSYGYSFVCSCPTRQAIYLKYNR